MSLLDNFMFIIFCGQWSVLVVCGFSALLTLHRGDYVPVEVGIVVTVARFRVSAVLALVDRRKIPSVLVCDLLDLHAVLLYVLSKKSIQRTAKAAADARR